MDIPEDQERYLFGDEGAPPDAEVQRLERLLGRYRHRPEPLRDEFLVRPRTLQRVLAAAAAFVAIAFVVDRFVLEDGARWIETGPGEVRRIAVGDIGHVELEAGSRLLLDAPGDAPYSLFLERGALAASIFAEPRVFQVGTPMGLTVDLGCVYRIEVGEEGADLSVTSGQVLFETEGRTVHVPEGYGCRSVSPYGPCAPVRLSDRDLLAAVRALESHAGPSEAQVGAVVEGADAITLWNLLGARAASVREGAFDELSARTPPPRGLTREAILTSESARMTWREELVEWRWEPILNDSWGRELDGSGTRSDG